MSHDPFVDPQLLQKLIDEEPGPVLLDFTASWCGPCKTMAPHLEAFAQERAQSLKVVKVDIDQYRVETARFLVRSVPTLILLKEGQVLGVQCSAMTRAQLGHFVDSKLA